MKYQVTALVTISLNAEVEADTEKKAKKLAAELDMPSLCHFCGGEQDDGFWSTSGELDGPAVSVEVER